MDKVIDMNSLLYNCKFLRSIDDTLKSWKLDTLNRKNSLFSNRYSLDSLNNLQIFTFKND